MSVSQSASAATAASTGTGTGPALVKIEHLSKRYGEHRVLNDVSLSIGRSEVVCIIGPSGSGKSTLLKCVNLLEPFDAGRITVGDLPIDPTPAGRAYRQDPVLTGKVCRKVAMVFQHFNLWPHLTAVENVSLPLTLVHGYGPARVKKHALQMLEKVGLESKADAYPARLSGGQQQRVGIARALAVAPEIILFDEPTSSLDPELVGEVLEVMKGLARNDGLTMLIVTHEMHFAAEAADRIVFLDEGSVVESGSPRDVFRNPQNERTRRFLETWLKRNALFRDP